MSSSSPSEGDGSSSAANAAKQATPSSWMDEDFPSDDSDEEYDPKNDDANDGVDSEDDEMDEEESDEDSDQDSETRILRDYNRLLSRRVDLVGDYAGDELFLIDGDSLLLRCFADDLLDLSPGFQLLHAAYNVELFLSNLAKRKCKFHIAFFDNNRASCIPPAADRVDAPKYYLARAAIIRHLHINLAESHPEIAVRAFDSYEGETFASYLKSTGFYFVMCHDGALPTDRKGKHVDGETDGSSELSTQRVALRETILFFVRRGYNAALINGLEWHDTKVITMVLEEHRKTATSQSSNSLSPPPPLQTTDCSKELQMLHSSNKSFTERQQLAVVTIVKMLQDPAQETDAHVWQQLCWDFLLHLAILEHVPLSSRRIDARESNDRPDTFVRKLAAVSEAMLSDASWADFHQNTTCVCDLADYMDGRLFLQVSQNNASDALPNGVQTTLEALSSAVQALGGAMAHGRQSQKQPQQTSGSQISQANGSKKESLAVLPFSNPVFDSHLESIRLEVDERVGGDLSFSSARIFREVTHWHNAKKPIIPKGVVTARSAKEEFWVARRNQWFMAEMRTYAASLTNAVGKSLEPETIVVGAIKTSTKAQPNDSMSDSDASSSSSKAKTSGKKGGGGKTAAKNAGKQAMMNSIAAAKAKKDEATGDKVISSWRTICKNLDAEPDLRSRYLKTKDYFAGMQSAWRVVVGAECELFLLNALLLHWIEVCRQDQQRNKGVAALIWSLCSNIAHSKNGLTSQVVESVKLTVKTLELPPIKVPEVTASRPLAFQFALPAKVESLSVQTPSRDFQLLECGPYLERTFDATPDERVEFTPDGWQRRVLDAIDAKRSLFVVAPTSAGKTFISFYAMRQILEADDDSVLVYVAPTKALVNQVAAEIQARYSKKFKYGGKSVWAIHTRDYRINNPTGCQVLVTVPHVLQIMLLAPSHATSWAGRLKNIIFDEVHSIGQAEDGVVWEQLLLMAPCPIIALSATVGNPNEFSSWLSSTQQAIGQELETVQHPYRYSDLRKYYYMPPKTFEFSGLPEIRSFGALGLEMTTGFNFVHPVAGLVDRSRGVPEDFSMEPRDCLTLWRAMVQCQTDSHPVSDDLNPSKNLPETARKSDVLAWEKELKKVLRSWIVDADSPYDKLIGLLSGSFRDDNREVVQTTTSQKATSTLEVTQYDLESSTLPLLCRLHEQDALPAIMFNYDRHACESLCQTILDQLAAAEDTYKKTNKKWQSTLTQWDEWKKAQQKIASKKFRPPSKSSKKMSKDDREDAEGDRSSKLDQQRDAAGDGSAWDTFNPDAPVEGYHFADHKKLQTSELETYIRQLGRRKIEQWLIDSLTRGVGVHHAGMNRKYRQVVEILFRKGFLRVIIATGTLALGINMPAKTVVFGGDSVFLTALNYRQCAGRAGRRGFDLLGNVVFHGLERSKVCRLLSSRLPDLNGHFPITTTLTLRLFTLLHESKNSKYAVTAINSLLSQPRMYMGGPSFKDQTMHHLRFSIEYLRRQQLLAPNGATLNFAGLVSHLYFTENSSFAFHALLKEGYFHELCANIDTNEIATIETLMLVMSHLFKRIPCRPADEEYREKVVKPSSSMVFLPPLPAQAANILREHNQQTLDIFRTYVRTFVDQHINDEERDLPLTGLKAGNGAEGDLNQVPINSLSAPRVRSSFVALSGHGDDFASIHELCHSARSGVFLEEAVIPHVGVFPDETSVPLNAWLLDFYKHGDINTIERANKIRRSDIWFMLNDFSLVLATIITSLMNFMKLRPGTDMDMIDIMGNLDAHEEAEDDKVAASEPSDDSQPVVGDPVTMPERPIVAKKVKAKNAESWADVADEEDAVDEAEGRRVEAAAKQAAYDESAPAWEEEGNEGLRNVLKAMQKLQLEFNTKFRAMWA